MSGLSAVILTIALTAWGVGLAVATFERLAR